MRITVTRDNQRLPRWIQLFPFAWLKPWIPEASHSRLSCHSKHLPGSEFRASSFLQIRAPASLKIPTPPFPSSPSTLPITHHASHHQQHPPSPAPHHQQYPPTVPHHSSCLTAAGPIESRSPSRSKVRTCLSAGPCPTIRPSIVTRETIPISPRDQRCTALRMSVISRLPPSALLLASELIADGTSTTSATMSAT